MYHEIHLFDTEALTPEGYPKRVAIVSFMLNRPKDEVLYKPNGSELLDDAIDRVLTEEERSAVLDDNPYIEYDRCCALCGHSLRLRDCSGCQRPYRDDAAHAITGVDLPPKLRSWFENQGHVFGVDCR